MIRAFSSAAHKLQAKLSVDAETLGSSNASLNDYLTGCRYLVNVEALLDTDANTPRQEACLFVGFRSPF